MKPAPLSALACAAFLCAAAPLPDDLAFHTEKGAELSKRFLVEGELELADIAIQMNGEDMDPAMIGMDTDLFVAFGYRLVCADAYEGLADGRPTALVRTFEELVGWSDTGDGKEEEEVEDVAGKSVRFDWDEEEEAYAASYVDEEGDDEDLAGVGEDLDLRGLLPAREVKEGDTWTVESGQLWSVLVPGFDIPGLLEKSESDSDMPEALRDAMKTLLEEISATCVYRGTEEADDGRTLAVIEVKSEVDEAIPLDPGMLNSGGDGPEMSDQRLDITIGLDLEGRCLWDVAAGNFHSFELEGFGELGFDAAMSAEEMGMDLAGTGTFNISLQQSASVETR